MAKKKTAVKKVLLAISVGVLLPLMVWGISSKISELTALTSLAGNDVFVVVDTSETETKKIARSDLVGIADNDLVEIDDSDAADNDYGKFTANGLEGRSYAEVKADLDLEIGTDVLAEQTIGVADNNLLEVDDAGPPAAGQYARFTANGLEGRTEAEFKGDFNLELGTDVLAQQTIGIADNNLVEVDGPGAGAPASGEYAKWTANGLEGKSKAEHLSDLNVADGADVTGNNAPQAHKTSHQNTGGDEVSVVGLSGLLADDQHVLDAEVKLIKLDDFATPDDNTDLNASTSRHGLLKKLDNVSTNFMNGQGGWSAPAGNVIPGLVIRSKFRWKDANEIYIGAGLYHHNGTVEQNVYWNSELFRTFTSLGASDWSYLYIDDSAVVTLGSTLLTATEFIDSITEPTYNPTKKGWYNGLDRAIMAVYTSGASAILEFFHDGNMVIFADRIMNQAAIDIDLVYTDIGALIIPKFTTVGIVFIDMSGAGAAPWWRTNGQSGSTGHELSTMRRAGPFEAITDASQVIEGKHSISDAETSTWYTEGWKFPIGM